MIRYADGPAGNEKPSNATGDAGPGLAALRWPFAGFMGLLNCGLLLASFAVVTDAGPIARGLAVGLMWSGQAVLAVAAHRHGRRCGDYLFGERASLPVTTFSVGMMIVATIATIEAAAQ